MNALTYVGCALLIVGCPTIALLVRSGRLPKWPKAYYESDADDTVRNGAFALLPFSAMFAVVLLGIALGSRGGAWEYATLVSLVAMLALLWLGLRWMKRPPAWLQPQWRLAAERGEEFRASDR